MPSTRLDLNKIMEITHSSFICKRREIDDSGNSTFRNFLYIPNRYRDEFIELSQLFRDVSQFPLFFLRNFKSGVYWEIAFATMITGLLRQRNTDSMVLKGESTNSF